MGRLKNAISVITAVTLLFSFCGCLRYTSNLLEITGCADTTIAPPYNRDTTAGEPEPPATLTPPPQTTEAERTTAVQPATQPDTTGNTDNNSPSSWTKKQIVAFTAAAVNKTKAYSDKVQVNHKEWLECNVTKCTGGSIIKNIANGIIKMVVKPTDEIMSFSGGKATNSENETVPLLLPKRNEFSLDPKGVASATAVKNNSDTVIHIQLVKEVGTLTEHPKYHAGSVGYLDAGDVDLTGVTLNYLNITYSGTTMDITVNSEGYVTQALYKIPIEIACEGKASFITAQVECLGEQNENWIINWD